MHKRRVSPAAAEFFATCIIWGLVLFVTLQFALHRPRTGHTLSTSAESPTAGAAGVPIQLPSNTRHTATHQPPTIQHNAEKGVLSPTKQLKLVPQSYTGESLVVTTTSTAPYIDWTLNWAHHLKRLDVKHAVVALDHATVTALAARGMPAVLDASVEARELGLMTHKSVRREYEHLRTLGYLRVGLPFHLMQQYNWKTLILSDADVIWLKHPSRLLQLYPDAELMVSTDCLSVNAVTERRPEVYRCGMQPGGWNSAWNSGLVVVRNTSAAVQVMTSWRDAMAPGSVSKSPEGWWVDDQLALTQLLDEDSLPFQGIDEESEDATSMDSVSSSSSNSSNSGTSGSSSSSSSSRDFCSPTVLTMKRQLKTVALSPLDIAGGHVAFHQRLPEAYNVTPFAVHYTFQAKFDNAGKLSRVRESNHWVMDPPERLGSGYLTYQNTVQAWIGEVEALWQKHTERQMVDMHKHLLAAGYQLQVLAEALAAAQVLNRTLVPPRMICYCTQDSVAWTDPLHTCAIAGSDELPPFQCTMDNLINVVELQRNYEQVMRTPDFLKRPEVKAAVGGSVLSVKWVQEQASSGGQQQQTGAQLEQQQQQDGQYQQQERMPARADVYTMQLLAAMQATADANSQPVLPLKVTEKQLRQQLSTYTATAVIDMGLLAPGWFGGAEDPNLAAAVQQMVKDLTVYVGWCCLLEQEEGQNMNHAYVEYQKPVVPVLQGRHDSLGASDLLGATGSISGQQLLVDHNVGVAWQPAVELFQRPAWCNAEYLRLLNFNISMRAQHPCRYLDGVEYTADMQLGMLNVVRKMHTNML